MSTGVYLCRPCIPHIPGASLPKAERLLTRFVRKAGELYGQRIYSINLHSLVHLVDCVRWWGPLFTTSAFAFEHMNGYFLSFYAGTSHKPKKALESFSLTHLLHTAETKLNPATLHTDVRKMFYQLGGLKHSDALIEYVPYM